MPKISVLTPVYNAADYIGEAIKSVARSDFTDYEHIIVDDGSNDSSREEITRAINSLNNDAASRIKVFSKTNSGEADTDNYALSKSTGEFLLVLNADDIVGPSLLRRSMEVMEAHGEAVVTYPDWSMIDGKGNQIDQIKTQDFKVESLIGGFECIPGPGACIRRVALGNSLLRDPSYPLISDYECWQRLSLKGDFIRIPEFHAFWRLHGENLSIKSRGKIWADQAIRVARKFSEENTIVENRRLRKLALLGLSRAYLLAAIQGSWDREVPTLNYLLNSARLGLLNGRLVARKDIPILLKAVYVAATKTLKKL
jgi:glycosyltransferase involved in cell wall biosynthesis